MKVDFKFYKTFDMDLISLSVHGISIPELIKKTLFNYVRGIPVHYYIPDCRPISLENRKRVTHIVVNIDDPESVAFLKNNIKFRQRAAFLRTLLRDSLCIQQLSPFVNDEWLKENETKRIKNWSFSQYKRVEELCFKEKPSMDAQSVLSPSQEENILSEDNSVLENRFGDVGDLSLSKKNKAKKKEKEVYEDELPFCPVNEDNATADDDDYQTTLDKEIFDLYDNTKNE